MTPGRVLQALDRFRREPMRGRAAVLELQGSLEGYALLTSFLSNEYGGVICFVDELYVSPAKRGQGHGTSLFEQVMTDRTLWPEPPVGISLEVRPENLRARRLYERLGFKVKTVLLQRNR